MLKRISKTLLILTLACMSVIWIGCDKGKKGKDTGLTPARTAYGNCVTRLNVHGYQYGAQQCGNAGTYYVCSLNQYLSGYCSTGGTVGQPIYTQLSVDSYFNAYLTQAPATEVQQMIYQWNNAGTGYYP